MNSKVNVLIRMSVINSFKSEQLKNDCFQTILISNRLSVISTEIDVLFIELEYELNLYQRVHLINQVDELCNEYQQAMIKNEEKFHEIKLKECQLIDQVLFKKKLL